MGNYSITLHCVRYDPVRCETDPELIWQHVQRLGGSVQGLNFGCYDFYVPDRVLSLVMLLDSELKLIESRSYI